LPHYSKPAIPAGMEEQLHPALLPLGLSDLLPPEAAVEADLVARLMAVLASHGYDRVKPPLFEFEEALLSGAGAAMATETFRFMDPISQRMVGLRADMTTQVARIAMTRLKGAPRPLRLSYAGQVLRVRGSQLRPDRQVGQAGAELIGSEDPAADVEIIGIAAEALKSLGIAGFSVDLTLPTLVAAVCAALLPERKTGAALRAALNQKDAARVAKEGGPAAAILGRLLAAAGDAAQALPIVAALALPPEAAKVWAQLVAVVELLQRTMPWLPVTIDPVENRGFEYDTGPSFSFFAREVRAELGRGGRYRTGNGGGEPATGVTFYTDTLLTAVKPPPAPARVYVPAGTAPEKAARLRGEGKVAIAGLAAVADPAAEARRLGCSHLLDGDTLVTLA
jgi:ATP phosphoribosyltransferase regulatory subunit